MGQTLECLWRRRKIQGSKASNLQRPIWIAEDENIETYFLWVDETMNAIKGLGEEIDESIIVQKVLRSLPMRFDPNISTLEEIIGLDSISMDELHGIFTTYEMRT